VRTIPSGRSTLAGVRPTSKAFPQINKIQRVMHYIEQPLFFWTLERWVRTPVLLGSTRNTGQFRMHPFFAHHFLMETNQLLPKDNFQNDIVQPDN
jgi:hypothetical protein